MNKLKKVIKEPQLLLLYILNKKIFKSMSDEKFLKLKFHLQMKKKLDLENPKTFNEKLQWLKLNDRNPKYTQLVDKYKVRNYVRKIIGEEYLVPLLGVWDSVEAINWDKLPHQFVLKTTHDSGGVVICADKNKISTERALKVLSNSLARNYYHSNREWPYKNIQPRVVGESFMEERPGESLIDYKIMCFNGEPKIIQVMSDRDYDGFNINHYDVNWKELNINRNRYNKNPKGIQKPIKLNEMLEISRALSKNIPFLRVDLYYVNEKIYFGELTFYPASGYMDFSNISDDYLLGSWIDLPN